MEVKLYNKIIMNISDEFESVSENEKAKYFPTMKVPYVFVLKEKEAVIGALLGDAVLKDEGVAERLAGYQKLYSRMTPGFQMGEMLISDKIGQNVAIMTYKSNAPTRDLYNILALTTLEEKEFLIIFSCDLQDSIQLMNVFLKTLDSIKINKEE